MNLSKGDERMKLTDIKRVGVVGAGTMGHGIASISL